MLVETVLGGFSREYKKAPRNAKHETYDRKNIPDDLMERYSAAKAAYESLSAEVAEFFREPACECECGCGG